MLAISKEQCLLVLLLVILNLKEQSPSDLLYQLLPLEKNSFDSIVVCWLFFESAIRARVASCRP